MAIGGPKEDLSGGDDALFAEINITPLTDIFLVLLIIFMVTSSVMARSDAQRSGVRVNLPTGAAKDVIPGKKDITVAISKEGDMVVDGKPVAVDTLSDMFKAAASADPDAQVVVQADADAHHGRVVAVMELAKHLGIKRLAIATRRK